MRFFRHAAAVLIALAAAALTSAAALAATATSLSPADSSLLARMNAVRAAHHLRPLQADPRLESAAVFHDRQMLASGVFAHGNLSGRLGRFGVRGRIGGENLAWGVGASGSPAGIVAAWLASPEHRANLLRPSFRRVGVSAVLGTFQGHADAQVVTADFAG